MMAWFNDERLSAYLDGELSPQERRSFEERLAADPAAKSLLAELRAQREILQNLPRFSVPRDLSQSVVALAEQRRGEGPKPEDDFPKASVTEMAWSFRAILTRTMRPRNLGWALVAATIGIAIALISPRPGRDGGQVEVAQRVRDEAAVAAKQQTDSSAAELRASPSARPVEEAMARSAAEASAMGAPQVAASPAGEIGSPVSTGRGGEVPLATNHEREKRSDSPEVVIERVVPMAGRKSAGARLGSTLPTVSAVASFEIVCDVRESASLQTLVGRVIRRHQAIPEEAAVEAAWEFAANREEVREKASVPGGGAAADVRPDVTVSFAEQEGFEEAVIEFSATLAQVQAVLAELGAQSGQVGSISVPRELAGLIEGGQRPAADRIGMQSGRAGPPPMAAAPSIARAHQMSDQQIAPSAEGQAFAGAQAKQGQTDGVGKSEPGAKISDQRRSASARATAQELYRIRIVLRHRRDSEAVFPGGIKSQAPSLEGTAVPTTPSPQK
ncbi:MAG: anti-sigma factor family protein [Thermogutta sp.]